MENFTEMTRNFSHEVFQQDEENSSVPDLAQSGQQIVSDQQLDTGLFVLNCVLTPLFTITGVTGNIFSLIVLLHHNMRNGVNLCLAAMAVSDSFFLITAMLRKATCIIDRFDPTASNWFYVYTFGPLFYLNVVFSRITTCLTLLITVNRFVAVLFPVKIKLWSGRGRLAGIIVFIYVATFLLILPVALVYDVGEVSVPDSNVTKPYLILTKFYWDNRHFVIDYSQIFLVILFRYIPAIVLVILNVSIGVALKRSSKLRAELTSNVAGERKNDDHTAITKMLLTISVLFLVALIPGNLVVILNQMLPGFSSRGRHSNLYSLVNGVTFLLEIINSSVNFIVYMAVSKTFSRTYLQLFGCRKRKTQNSSTRETLQTPSERTTDANPQ